MNAFSFLRSKRLWPYALGVGALLLLFASGYALKSALKQPRLMPLEFWVVGPFGADLQEPYPPEQDPDVAKTYPNPAGGPALKWQKAAVDGEVGCVDFRRLYKAEHACAYAQVWIYSPSQQNGSLLTGSDDTLKIWLNDQLVHQSTRLRSGKPEDDRVEVHWNAGWNRVLAKVGNATGDHQFYFKAAGRGLRWSLTAE